MRRLKPALAVVLALLVCAAYLAYCRGVGKAGAAPMYLRSVK